MYKVLVLIVINKVDCFWLVMNVAKLILKKMLIALITNNMASNMSSQTLFIQRPLNLLDKCLGTRLLVANSMFAIVVIHLTVRIKYTNFIL